MPTLDADPDPACERLAALLDRLSPPPGVAVAESLTGGLVLARLVGVPGSGAWLRGGVVAYHSDVKRSLLAVPPGPVVCAEAAGAMAAAAARLLGAPFAVATTGVAGPDPQDGVPPGQVFVGVCARGAVSARHEQVRGGPEEVRAGATALATAALADAVEASIAAATALLVDPSTDRAAPVGPGRRGRA